MARTLTEDAPEALRRAVVRGLFSTSIVSLFACLATTTIAGGLLLSLLRSDLSVLADGSPGYWAIDQLDEPAFASAKAIELGRASAGPPRIIVSGSSLMRAALGDPARMESILERALGHDVTFATLAMGAQTMAHSLALLEIALTRQGGLVVIGLNELTLGVGSAEQEDMLDRYPLAVSSTAAGTLVRETIGSRGRLAAFGPLWSCRFYVLRASTFLRNLVAGRRPTYEPRYPFELTAAGKAGKGFPRVPFDRVDARVRKYLTASPQDIERVLDQLRAIIGRLKQRPDVRMVLVLDPLNPRVFATREKQLQLAALRQRIERLAAEQSIPLLTGLRDTALPAEAFLDYGHVVGEPNRDLLRQALARQLVGQLGQLD